ncbi:hypothetical protein Hanom_Chr02g00145861 [Helianthus anomalus]
MIPAQLVDALEMMGKDSGSTLDPTRVLLQFIYSRGSAPVEGATPVMWQEAGNFIGDSVTPLSTRRGPG